MTQAAIRAIQDEPSGVWIVVDGSNEITPFGTEIEALRASNVGAIESSDTHVVYYVPYGESLLNVRGW